MQQVQKIKYGKIHDNQKEYDEERQKVIESYGINFIRISNEEVVNSIDLLKEKIKVVI